MSAFDDLRRAARAASDGAAAAHDRAALARDALARLRVARAAVARRAAHGDAEASAELAKLDAQIADAEHATSDAARARGTARGTLAEAFRDFVAAADPRAEAGRLTTSMPILLLPVRMETRFRDNELWVRVYPDDWAADGFEARLSESEVETAGRYWAEEWRAQGDRGRRLAAWRSLVASHGSGRAAWVLQQLQPLNPADQPPAPGPAGPALVLVVARDNPLPAAARPAAATFWEAVWRSAREPAAVATARAALSAAVGAATAAVVEAQPPSGLDDEPPAGQTRATATVHVAFLELPTAATANAKPQSWTEPAAARVLPDCWVLLGYAGGAEVLSEIGKPIPDSLLMGPDPSAAATDQFTLDADGNLTVPEGLRWMVDFDRAVDEGMGFRVPLTAATAGGFDRLLVVGLRLRSDPEEARLELEALLTHHQYSRQRFSLVPQGTPTNNSEAKASGFDRNDDADASFHDWFDVSGPLFTHESDWAAKRDGQWLAECLGIDPAVLAKVPNAGGADQLEARAANTALWPATWGYFLETMLHPVLDSELVEWTRRFFVQYVSGRGLVPAVRIGNQPYGILPTTAYSRWSWATEGFALATFGDPRLPALDAVLRRIAADWAPLADAAPHVGTSVGDAHQLLLDVVGLHANSVEFHQRYAESLDDLVNRASFGGLGPALFAILLAIMQAAGARDVLTRLGYDPAAPDPDILQRFFFDAQQELRGPLVDDRPLSEADPVHPTTTDGRNYLQWLVDAARTSIDTLRREDGFPPGGSPTALLYLLLRHALLLSWWDAGILVDVDAQVMTPDAAFAARREAPFVHVAETAAVSESRYARLYDTDARVTGNADLTIADFLVSVLFTAPATLRLRELAAATERLVQTPTARLERVLAEHLDLCTYRLDAWRLGLVHSRLLSMRLHSTDDGEQARPGVYLGAYGWLDDVRPAASRRKPVTLTPDLAAVFPPDPAHPTAPLERDPANGGHVHAPSLNHAATAAVLRSGYLANTGTAHPDALAVNLSSGRVRAAQAILEGIRNGQSMSALLGYQFERGLHDRHNEAEVDVFVFALRRKFPFRGGRLDATLPPAGTTIQQLEARNVIDGLDFVEHLARTGNHSYPFGFTDLPPSSAGQRTAIDAEVDQLFQTHDAVSDLALAEGVHQAVLGNFERAASTLDAFSKSGFPPEPAVVQTPRSGTALTHRVALHLPAASVGVSPLPGVAMTPRADADPSLNAWLASVLPAPADVVARVRWRDPRTGTADDRLVSQADVGLQAIDLLAVLTTADISAMSDLDDRIVRFVLQTAAPRPDAILTIHYAEPVAGKTTFFQVSALVDHLRAVVTKSRPMRPTDVVRKDDARPAEDDAVTLDPARITGTKTAVEDLRDDLALFVADLGALVEPAQNLVALRAQVDIFLGRLADLLARASRFGLVHGGFGAVFDGRRRIAADVVEGVDALIGRLAIRRDDAAALLAAEAVLGPGAADEERFKLLSDAERLVTTTPTVPPPATPGAYRPVVVAAANSFATKIASLGGARNAATAQLSALLDAIRSELPLAAFVVDEFDLASFEAPIAGYATDLLIRARATHAEIETRLKALGLHLDAAATATTGPAVVAARTAAIRAVLGEDTLAIPEFTVDTARAAEWSNALAYEASGQLTAHLATRDFPVDDWLAGLARVREKLWHWEQATVLVAAVGAGSAAEPTLRPVQLPFEPGSPWLALELPPNTVVAGDRLLYTASYPVGFVPSGALRGLLVDEWVETLPGEKETTAIAFHYDRPNAEPPQAWLLIVPPAPRANWEWDDIVASLHDTLAFARTRAVEPSAIDVTAYSQFLPATVSAATFHPISIALDLAANNGLVAHLEGH